MNIQILTEIWMASIWIWRLRCWLYASPLRCPVVHVLTALCPLLFPVTAVYDVTLNFKDQQTPTLLGIVQGKKYKADLKIKWVQPSPRLRLGRQVVTVRMMH